MDPHARIHRLGGFIIYPQDYFAARGPLPFPLEVLDVTLVPFVVRGGVECAQLHDASFLRVKQPAMLQAVGISVHVYICVNHFMD